MIEPPDRYEKNLDTKLQVTHLDEQIHESKDYVQIAVTASVYWRYADARKALLTVEDATKEIKELGVATLQQIIRSSALVDIAGTSKVTFSKETPDEDEKDEKPKDAAKKPARKSR